MGWRKAAFQLCRVAANRAGVSTPAALPAADPPDNTRDKGKTEQTCGMREEQRFAKRHMNRRLNYRNEWTGNIRADILSGLVVALALIPEAIAFSLIAGVDPKVGLYASFSIAVITAILGGRPGMISAATAATAVLMGSLVREHGLDYLLAATVLAGLLQIGMGLLRLGFVMRFVSKSVMTGFVNALAILIFMAQLPELDPRLVTPMTYVLVAAALAIIYLFPYVNRSIPSPLVAIVVLTGLSLSFGWDVRSVGDMGQLPDALPSIFMPNVPFTIETFLIVLPYALAVAVVGLLESLMTQQIVDDMTDTVSDRNQECLGQGVANTLTGFIGGMAGCAMIGQSVINVRSGGRGRLSTFVAGVMLLVFCVGLGEWVSQIPMPALVAIMIMVSVGTFSWASLGAMRTMPRSSTAVMLATVITVVWTHNLAIGVLVGVLMSGVFFAAKIARLFGVTSVLSADGAMRTYHVSGQMFFGSVEAFRRAFDPREALERVIIDVSAAHVWDISSIEALEGVVAKFLCAGTPVEVIGMNAESEGLFTKLRPLIGSAH